MDRRIRRPKTDALAPAACSARRLGLLPSVGGLAMMVLAHLTPTVAESERPAFIAEPIALMKDGAIAGCGLKAIGPVGGGRAGIELTLRRDAEGAHGTRFFLSGLWRDPEATAHTLSAVSVATVSVDTARTFSQPKAAADGRFEASGELSPDVGSALMQELVVSGGSVNLTRADGQTLAFDLAGPMTLSARAGYLNC
ncbi:MAG: hypothetical protein ACRCS9_13800, partial [Hyphomicrobium sp.]